MRHSAYLEQSVCAPEFHHKSVVVGVVEVVVVLVVGREGGGGGKVRDGLLPSGTRFVDGDSNARSDDLASSGIESVNV
jgi:hypothetical protein